MQCRVRMQAIQSFRSELKAFIRSQWTSMAGVHRYAIVRSLPGAHRGDHGYTDTLLRLPLPPRLRAAYGARRSTMAAATGPLEKYPDDEAAAADPEQLVGLGALDGEAADAVFEGLRGAEAGWTPNMVMMDVEEGGSGAPRVAVAKAGGLGQLAMLMQCPVFSVRPPAATRIHAWCRRVCATARC